MPETSAAAADPSSPGSARPDFPVKQDVAGPAHRGQHRQTDAQIVGGRRGPHQHGHRARGGHRTEHVGDAARTRQRHGQRAEEFQGDGQPEPDPLDRGIEGQVHHGENQRQPQHHPPLGGTEAPEPRPAHRHQHDGGHPLADRHHPGRTEHGECQRRERGPGLVGQATEQHQRHTAPAPPGAGDGGVAGHAGLETLGGIGAVELHASNAGTMANIRKMHPRGNLFAKRIDEIEGTCRHWS